MNKKEWYFNILIGALVVAIITTALVRFVFKPANAPPFNISPPENIPIADMSGDAIPLSAILNPNGETYCFIFDVRDCGTCILKGKDDIFSLTKAGQTGCFIMINDNAGETAAWAASNEIPTIFTLKKADFYRHFSAAATPVMATFRGYKAESHRYILP